MRRNRFALHFALVVLLLHMPSAHAAAPAGGGAVRQSQPARQATATSAVTKTAHLVGDADGDGRADPGDTIRYTVAISNATGLDATGVTLT
ncbi:MAG TPA: hypothetical protein VFT99_23945, partial [Roseiflexaceae bacterium]|nr:hypothetical protein [Roseiflexaceae bacterium]